MGIVKIVLFWIFIVFAVIVIEHGQRIRSPETKFKPSVLLNFIYECLSLFFRTLGAKIADISSFLKLIIDLIKLEELQKTLMDLINPTLSILCSPYETIIGYVEEITRYFSDYKYLVIAGTIILALLSLLILFLFIRWMFRRFPKLWHLVENTITFIGHLVGFEDGQSNSRPINSKTINSRRTSFRHQESDED